jgi:hypothetical protein
MFCHHHTGALLLSDQVFHKEHYLFWGDSDICIATTENLIHYTNTVRQSLSLSRSSSLPFNVLLVAHTNNFARRS